MMIHCRQWLIVGSFALSLSSSIADADPTHGWQRVAPSDAGFSPMIGEELDRAAQKEKFAGLHAVVVVRAGRLVLERYCEGPDERWGKPLGTVVFGPEIKHDLRSVSKSIVSLLYGAALSQKKVPGLDQSLIDQFPDYDDLVADPDRRRITVAHALSMTLGTEWNEDLPYDNPQNSEIAMEMAADRYRFVLDRPLKTEPGSQWNYNGGATAVLAHLISRGTAMPLLDYAHQTLFAPMGITDVEWIAGTNGEAAAASGLRMRPRDLAKIGQLILNEGRWNGAQLVPADWLEQSFAPRSRVDEETEYGYQWWVGTMPANGQPWIAAFGNGGQRLFVIPGWQLAVVVTAGNYNAPDQWKLPLAVMTEVVIPALRDE
ncbi:MAG: serine hydrolase domain-containing protein [Geminicoccaceae bacterium]